MHHLLLPTAKECRLQMHFLSSVVLFASSVLLSCVQCRCLAATNITIYETKKHHQVATLVKAYCRSWKARMDPVKHNKRSGPFLYWLQPKNSNPHEAKTVTKGLETPGLLTAG